ncbi:MAG: tRNA uridine-5-carboxymethylaminomethyl(34) synthesis GTPase MnmE, partial [candidate division Zixibacteria bacterium]|nr:tRNA uridine-5-carboxymethylaminomethyl(34) synthesis GTPase MnmE [candidate division Zixibacteria bacterium]
MRDFGLNDTITAIATPPGEGAIAVVRLSGKEAIKAVDEIFKGKTLLTQIPSGSARYGKIFDKEESEIDEVIVTVMHAPNSYTGEDTVEISCHGGYLPSSKIIKLLTGRGIREAERGEFTLRAFLNNRIDLTKAEAVADMVSSKSELAYNSALKQLSGKLHERIKEEIDKLSGILSTVELGIDFAEEGIELSSRDDIRKSIEDIIYNLKYLIEGYETGRILKDGYRVAITGKVNVGKSSLMNTLLGSERVIVTDIPGTTRDSITESISFNGLEIHLTDTAGFRDRTERIEAEGIKRAADIIAASDLAIVMLDSTTGFTDDDNRVLETASNTKTITALN